MRNLISGRCRYVCLPITVFLMSSASVFSDDKHTHTHDHEGIFSYTPFSQDHDFIDNDLKVHAHAEEGGDGHGEENISYITAEMANKLTILTETAHPKELIQTISVYGSIVTGPEELSHVRARFDGQIKSVKHTIGDYVKTGDILAAVESNVSLINYLVKAPISGFIVQRHANSGEVTKDQVLFHIANLDIVWAELQIFPSQQMMVAKGQSVEILTSAGRIISKIEHIVPTLNSPFQKARVRLVNNKWGLVPGLMTEAFIEVGRTTVDLAVAKEAVQTIENRKGVFIKQKDTYTFTPIVLGQSDDHYYEVVEGIKPGSEYVSKNSYLIKADIEKNAAEHVH